MFLLFLLCIKIASRQRKQCRYIIGDVSIDLDRGDVGFLRGLTHTRTKIVVVGDVFFNYFFSGPPPGAGNGVWRAPLRPSVAGDDDDYHSYFLFYLFCGTLV